MALGLPIAVTIGWQLATPATRSVAIDNSPGGAGGMGNAPARHARPARALDSSVVSAQGRSTLPSGAPSTVLPASGGHTSRPATGTPSGTPPAVPAEASEDPLPPLTMPPVPTPTEPDPIPSDVSTPSDFPTVVLTFEPRFRWSGH